MIFGLTTAPTSSAGQRRWQQPSWDLSRGSRACGRSDHHLLMRGRPGAGTSRLARRLATIVPEMTLAEAMETTRIHSVAGLTGRHPTLVPTRPWRAPHHTLADVGLIGGGQVPMPGEVSRAHHGVRFLDELPACRRHVLEVLRQPPEERLIYIQSPERYES